MLQAHHDVQCIYALQCAVDLPGWVCLLGMRFGLTAETMPSWCKVQGSALQVALVTHGVAQGAAGAASWKGHACCAPAAALSAQT